MSGKTHFEQRKLSDGKEMKYLYLMLFDTVLLLQVKGSRRWKKHEFMSKFKSGASFFKASQSVSHQCMRSM